MITEFYMYKDFTSGNILMYIKQITCQLIHPFTSSIDQWDCETGNDFLVNQWFKALHGKSFTANSLYCF